MNVSERRTEVKKAEKKCFQPSFRKLISYTHQKNKKEVFLKTLGTYFLHKKPQNAKMEKNNASKIVSGKIFRKISPNPVSRTVPKKTKRGQLYLQKLCFLPKNR